MTISKDLLQFLSDLKANNNRDWFNARKDIFKGHQTEAKAFFQAIHDRLEETDLIERHRIYRIYRDVRFSKDKTPFSGRFSGGFVRATAHRRGGYWLRIEPGGNSYVGGGFWRPNSNDLLRIRKEFEMDDTEVRTIMSDQELKTNFGGMIGEEVKTAPRGFDKEHPAIDLIRKKQFYFMRYFSDKEVLKKGFIEEVLQSYILLRPYFDYMSEVLTTNLNGEKLI